MKECTLGLLYFCKFGELFFYFMWTWYTWWNGIAFITKADPENGDMYLQYMAGLAIFLITYHFFFMNILINLRFWCRLQCVSLCKKPYTCCNFLFCVEKMSPYCTDKWFKRATMIKWVFFTGYFLVLGWLVREWNFA